MSIKEKLESLGRNSIQLKIAGKETHKLGATRFGGKPDVPSDFVWPTYEGESYSGGIAMSQIASFYLLKDGRRQELSNGDCSGAVYMAIWDWCDSELDLDVRFPAPQTEDTLDCALLEGELASKLLAALREQDLPELADEIAPDWDLTTQAVQSGLETLRSHLELVQGNTALLYEMT